MKKVFNTSEVAHIWAQQKQSEGRNSGRSVFFEGPTIYSYGHHFPMAKFVDKDTVLSTTRTYSVTTTGHCHTVRMAVGHKKLIEVFNPEAKTPTEHEDNLLKLIRDIQEKIGRAKRSFSIRFCHSEIERARANARNYVEVLKLRLTGEVLKAYKAVVLAEPFTKAEIEKLTERQAKYEAGEEQRRKSRTETRQRHWEEKQKAIEKHQEEARKDAEEKLELWLEGDNVYLSGHLLKKVYLRRKADEIETSMGASIPLAVAHKLWGRIKEGGSVAGLNLGHYTVDSYDGQILKAGCHTIELAEMQRLATVLGW